MRRLLLHLESILLILICGNTYAGEASPEQKTLSRDQVNSLIQETKEKIRSILRKEIYLPGIAVAFVSRDEMLWAEGFGYRDRSRVGKVDTSTMFGLLSISKTVTVTGLMLAVQEGLINLDVPIKTYLPDFRIQSRFDKDPMQRITIRHLLSMTSGLTHDAPVGNNADPSTPSYESHIRSIGKTWLRFRTGERAEYSNLGVELAAYILESVIHKPFTEYLREKLLDPLGMTRTTYAIERIRKEENRALGNYKTVDPVPLENPYLAPGGAYSTITDMARFIQFHLNHGRLHGKILVNEPFLEQMQTIPFPVKDQVEGYGQGLWAGYYHFGGQDVRWLSHGGGGFGFRCQMKWLPELGYGAMVMTNSQDHSNVNEDLVEEILQRVIGLMTGKMNRGTTDWVARFLSTRSVDSSYLPVGLEGTYNGTNDDFWFLIKDGRFGFAAGNSFVPLTPVSRDEYISSRFLYRFVRDASGNGVAVIGPYNGLVWVRGAYKDEPSGPAKDEWKNYAGTYVRKRFGVCEKFYTVAMKNGWLHFEGGGQDFRLSEHLPGLFFTPDGEAVDFRSGAPTFRNLRLYKALE